MKTKKMMMAVIAMAIAVASTHHHKKQPTKPKQATATDSRPEQTMDLTLMPGDLLLFFLTRYN